MKIAALAALLATLCSCASSTLIKSTDPAVKIYADGELIGTGSATYSDTKIVGSATEIKFKKDGCQPDIHRLQRNEDFQVGPCIGGVLVLFPFLWIMGYKAEHNYEFTCTK